MGDADEVPDPGFSLAQPPAMTAIQKVRTEDFLYLLLPFEQINIRQEREKEWWEEKKKKRRGKESEGKVERHLNNWIFICKNKQT